MLRQLLFGALRKSESNSLPRRTAERGVAAAKEKTRRLDPSGFPNSVAAHGTARLVPRLGLQGLRPSSLPVWADRRMTWRDEKAWELLRRARAVLKSGGAVSYAELLREIDELLAEVDRGRGDS